MLLFLLSPSFRLIVAAVIPALYLLIKVYRSDRIEKEPTSLLVSLVIYGFISTAIASVLERIGMFLLGASSLAEGSREYNFILYFLIVAVAEEGSKYFLLRRRTWNSNDFNCQYDGLIYSVFVSLGFAALENIKYVLYYGFSAAVSRAITAVPGHACFGVFMGVWYGIAKRNYNEGNYAESKICRILALTAPVFAHGLYDYSVSTENSGIPFIFVIVVMFITALILVRRASRKDRYI